MLKFAYDTMEHKCSVFALGRCSVVIVYHDFPSKRQWFSRKVFTSQPSRVGTLP